MMEIRVTSKQGKPPEIQEVTMDLKGVKFDQTAAWVNFTNVRCERVDFSGRRFRPFHALDATFIECDFSRASLTYAGLGIQFREAQGWSKQVLYRDCRFDRADMRHMPHIGNARFERCSFRETRMEGWRADSAEFIDCVFGGRMYDCCFAGRPWRDEEGATGRTRNEFHGNDFREVDLQAVQFAYGIDLDAQLLPEGDQYVRLSRPRERVDRVRALVSRWPDDADREYALGSLRIISSPGDFEQDQLFLDRRLYRSRRIPGVKERVLHMIEHALD
jgi:uncharacterized protein YjbI with pentapeptide repeats